MRPGAGAVDDLVLRYEVDESDGAFCMWIDVDDDRGAGWVINGAPTSMLTVIQPLPLEAIDWVVEHTWRAGQATLNSDPDSALQADLLRLRLAWKGLFRAHEATRQHDDAR